MARTKSTSETRVKKTLAKAKATASRSKPIAKTAARPTPQNLDAIARALTANDARAALVAALDAWRAARSPALADLIDTISTKITTPPIASDLEWTKAAANRDPAVLGGLLSIIRELPVSFLTSAAQRLDTFDDPRIATAAADWVIDPPTTSSSTYPFWTHLLDTLVRLGDTRIIAAFTKRVKMPPEASKQFPKAKTKKPSLFWGKFYTALDKTRGKLEASATPSSPSVDKAAIAKLAKQAEKLKRIETTATPKVVATGGKSSAGDSKMQAGPPLARALAHATGKRVGETIDALLEAWREKRAPELADLIDKATWLLPSYRGTLAIEAKSAHAHWQAKFESDPAGEMPRLLRHLHCGGAAAAIEHVIALAALPDDPRIAFRLAELASGWNISPERGQYWKTTWELIARTRDTRVIAPLRHDFDDFNGTYYDHHRSGRRLLGGFLLAEPPASPLDAGDFKAIAQIAAALDNIVPDHVEREHALLADVYANWSDEAPRLVYADWLIERENMRGHLIVLSCKQAREKLSKNEDKQLASLRGGFRIPTYLFGAISEFEHVVDRGLPSQIKAKWNNSPLTWRHLAGDPLLPCLDVIGFETDDMRGRPEPEDLARVMLDPTATRLVRVEGLPNDLVNTRFDARLDHRGGSARLVDALEPLVQSQWKRDGRNFTRE